MSWEVPLTVWGTGPGVGAAEHGSVLMENRRLGHLGPFLVLPFVLLLSPWKWMSELRLASIPRGAGPFPLSWLPYLKRLHPEVTPCRVVVRSN